MGRMVKLNEREQFAYASTLLQERVQTIWDQIEGVAMDLQSEFGDDVDSDIADKCLVDFMSGLLAKLVKRHQDGEWPEAAFGDEVEVEMSVKE